MIAPPQKPTTVDKSKIKKPTAVERSGIAIENTPSELQEAAEAHRGGAVGSHSAAETIARH